MTSSKVLSYGDKSQPELSKESDSQNISSKYRYWRWRIFYSMFIGYSLFYFTRKSYNFVMPLMLDELGFSKASFGILGTVLYLTYGISKFVSGMWSEHSNPRYFMAVGLLITGILNIMFGSTSTLWWLACICALNGWFQGFGWPPCTKLLTYWYSRSERGTWWSVCSLSHGIGGMLIPLFAGYVAAHYGWRAGMYLPGIVAIIGSLWLMNRLRDVPATLGLPNIEEYRQDTLLDSAEANTHDDQTQLSIKETLFQQVLNNPKVWLLAVAYLFIYLVRTGINDWGHLYLKEARGYEVLLANTSIFWFEIGGLAGMLMAGFGSDSLFRGNRIPVLIAYSCGLLIAIPCLYFAPAGVYWLDYSLMAIIGFLVYGPQMLVGLAVVEYVSKQAVCTANGFAGLFGYIGSAIASYPLGRLLDSYGWSGYFVTLTCCSFLALLLFMQVAGQPTENT